MFNTSQRLQSNVLHVSESNGGPDRDAVSLAAEVVLVDWVRGRIVFLLGKCLGRVHLAWVANQIIASEVDEGTPSQPSRRTITTTGSCGLVQHSF
ncbi:hypothetical protein [Xylella fastidiosa]|uniref:hypothetical protein n=1 Tax=Xylella fastidiosa TaxID=2371 RepID=UPI001F2BB349|nr:hypothetical protein [Xylella fastidiosa]